MNILEKLISENAKNKNQFADVIHQGKRKILIKMQKYEPI
jgi:hypothetical protein